MLTFGYDDVSKMNLHFQNRNKQLSLSLSSSVFKKYSDRSTRETLERLERAVETLACLQYFTAFSKIFTHPGLKIETLKLFSDFTSGGPPHL